MKNTKILIYRIFVLLSALLFFYSVLRVRTTMERSRPRDGYDRIDDYYSKAQRDDSAAIGWIWKYSFIVRDIVDDYRYLFVYTTHQNIKIYVGDECRYSMQATEGQFQWDSPGCVWNSLPLTPEDNGKRVTVELVPVYEDVEDIEPLMYLGTKYDVTRKIIKSEIAPLIFGTIICCVGCGLLLFVAWLHRRGKDYPVEKMLGLFAAAAGVWKLTSLGACGLWAIKYPVLSMMPYWTEAFMVIPFVGAVKAMLPNDMRERLWNVAYVVAIANIWLLFLAQYLDIADLRRTAWTTKVVLVAELVFCMIMTILQWLCEGKSKKILQAQLAIAMGAVWFILERLTDNIFGGDKTSVAGMILFLVYLAYRGLDTARGTRNLMAYGVKSRQYEKIAYYDTLTGFYNRTALSAYTENEEFTPENTIAAVFDINNLKKCNDELGHDKGDEYIRESARIIRECFGDIGQCYRAGGDEFYVMVNRATVSTVEKRMQEILDKVREFNSTGNPIQMGIAWGFAEFDSAVDKDIEDTTKRADQMMYIHKFEMKQKQAQNGEQV